MLPRLSTTHGADLARVRHVVAHRHAWHLSRRDCTAITTVLEDRDILRKMLETVLGWLQDDLYIGPCANHDLRQSRLNQVGGALAFTERDV